MSAEEERAALQANLKRFFYRGIETFKLLDFSQKEMMNLYTARARRKLTRNTTIGSDKFMTKLRKNKSTGKVTKTHLRNALITPEMVASEVAVYSGKQFVKFEVKVSNFDISSLHSWVSSLLRLFITISG
jgi:ribosomal protein uS19